jgi:hypothetical protein
MKSIVGLDVSEVNFDPLVECKAAVFERLKAFCSHTIHPNAPEVFMIENAADDPVFSKISSIRGDAHIQFYAGAPIVCDCMKIGTVSVLDDHPRPDFDEVKKETLRLFSEVAASLIQQCRPETIVDADTTIQRVDSVILKGLKEPLENLHVLNNQLTGSIENSLASKSDDMRPVEATDDTEVLTAFEKFEDGINQWQAITNASLQFALAVTQLEGPPRPHRHGCSEIPSGERTSPPSVTTATIRSLHSAVSSTSGELPIVATESGSLTDFYRSLIGKCEELRQLHKVVEWSAPEPERSATADEQPAQQHQQYLAIDYDILEREEDLGTTTIDSETFEGTIAAVIGYLSLMNFRQFNAISITVRVHFADPVNCDGTETASTTNHSSSFETTSRSSSRLKSGDHWEVLAEEPLDSFSDDRIGVFGEDRGSQDSQKHVDHIFTRSSDLDSGLGSKSSSSLTSTSSGNPDSRITSGIGDHFSMGIGIQFQDRFTKSNQSAFNQQEFQDEYGDEAEQWRLLEALVDSLGGEIEAGAENLTDRGSRTFRLMFSNIIHWKRLSEQESFVAPCTYTFGSGPHL